MAGPMKMRATLAGGNTAGAGGTTEIRVLMTHPMTTGQGGQPLHFIQNIIVKHNGRTVIESEMSQAVSRNPVFSFRLKGGAKGDTIEVSWLDNKGETNKIETAVA
jgi:sulfur-oxidizing protein SoxZ